MLTHSFLSSCTCPGKKLRSRSLICWTLTYKPWNLVATGMFISISSPSSQNCEMGCLRLYPALQARVFAYRTERVVGDPGTFVSGCLYAAGKGPHPEPDSRPAISFRAALTLSGAAPPGVGSGSAKEGSKARALSLAQPAGVLYETAAVIELYDRGSLRDLLHARLPRTNQAPPSQESARQSVLPCINPNPALLVPAPLRLPHLARSGWSERPGAGGAACACGSSDPDPTDTPCHDPPQLPGWSLLSSMGQGTATTGAAIQVKSRPPLGAGLCAAMGLDSTLDWPGWAASAGAHLALMPALCSGPGESAQVDGQQACGWGEGLGLLAGLESGSGLGGGMRTGSLRSAACGEPSCGSNSGTDVTSDAPSVSVAASAASRDMWSFSADCTVAAGAPADRAVPLMIKRSPEKMSGCLGKSASDGERSMFAAASLCCAAGNPDPDANPKTKPNPFAAAAGASFACVCAVRPGTVGAAAAAKGSGSNSGLGPGSESARLSSEAGPDGAGLVALLGDAAAAQELALDLLTLLEVGALIWNITVSPSKHVTGAVFSDLVMLLEVGTPIPNITMSPSKPCSGSCMLDLLMLLEVGALTYNINFSSSSCVSGAGVGPSDAAGGWRCFLIRGVLVLGLRPQTRVACVAQLASSSGQCKQHIPARLVGRACTPVRICQAAVVQRAHAGVCRSWGLGLNTSVSSRWGMRWRTCMRAASRTGASAPPTCSCGAAARIAGGSVPCWVRCA